MTCPCGHPSPYAECCERFHSGAARAPTPEVLMRSRYSAYAVKNIDYLERTLDPQTRDQFDHNANKKWADDAKFTSLEILSSREEGNKGFVEFKATYKMNDEIHLHHEMSKFRKQAGIWYFREGKVI